MKAEAPGVQIEGVALPVGQTKKLTNGDKLQIGKNAIYKLNLPADAQTTLDALQRTAVMEFRYFKDVISEKNPNAKYRMEIIHGNGTEPETYKFFDTVTKATNLGLTADVDLVWLHDFGRRFGWELGTRLGAGVCVAGSGDGRDWVGRVTPTVAFFGGFRF